MDMREITALQEENQMLKSQLAEADKRIKEYQAKIQLLEQTSVDKLETAVPQTYFENVANEDLKTELWKLTQENAQLVRKNNEDISEISKLEKENKEWKEYSEKLNGDLKELVAKLQTEKDELSNTNSSLHSQLENLQSEYDELKETKEDYYEQIKDWQERHNNDCITINQLNVTIDTLVDKYHRLREIHGLV
jgi:chromosome segregation ATPase